MPLNSVVYEGVPDRGVFASGHPGEAEPKRKRTVVHPLEETAATAWYLGDVLYTITNHERPARVPDNQARGRGPLLTPQFAVLLNYLLWYQSQMGQEWSIK